MLDSLVVLKHQRQNLYVCLEDLDFVWDEKNISTASQMWNEGLSVWDMARSFERDIDEVTLLIMDLKRRGRIQDRPGGAWGRRMPLDITAKGCPTC
ncbi:hypothetical protein [Paenibacillus sp. UNC451MF]|uniref:hypothetical protein n=1 Tax=Paenibacillus sp. UNC451MF TaxID=1449063 RepID=UPI0006901F64|nr:hypothetical protein [Paenibacillus sp. UNC451MF]